MVQIVIHFFLNDPLLLFLFYFLLFFFLYLMKLAWNKGNSLIKSFLITYSQQAACLAFSIFLDFSLFFSVFGLSFFLSFLCSSLLSLSPYHSSTLTQAHALKFFTLCPVGGRAFVIFFFDICLFLYKSISIPHFFLHFFPIFSILF